MTGSSKSKTKKQSLLIVKYKNEIINAVKNNQVVIIAGQTGCGKSTQVPQYLHEKRAEFGLNNEAIIACLHPRSVAAISLAERVSLETGTVLGRTVGYRVRFYTECKPTARIVYMTAGFMVRLLSSQVAINSYGIVIIDEAHERSVDNDVIMGQMKMKMMENDNLKLVIMSATMNVEEIEGYYQGAKVVRIASIADRIDVIYRPLKKSNDYVKEAVKIVLEILRESDNGHVLIFLPGEEKVHRCKKLLKENNLTGALKLLKLFSAMDKENKAEVFKEFGNKRKIIAATNIAETSLTIEGVSFVIDCGLVKRVTYDHCTGINHWVTERVSAAEADQRKGRTGRTGLARGKCYRLYENYDYEEKLRAIFGRHYDALNNRYDLAQLNCIANNDICTISDDSDWSDVSDTIDAFLNMRHIQTTLVSRRYPVSEIGIVNLGTVIMRMKDMKMDVDKFPFIVPPKTEKVKLALLNLQQLSLLDDDWNLTPFGIKAAKLPLSPQLAKVAVIGSKMPCHRDIIIIIAMLSVPNLFKKSSKKYPSDHSLFNVVDSDLIKLLNIYNEYCYCDSEYSAINWCKWNRIAFSTLKYAELIMKDLDVRLPSPRTNGYADYNMNHRFDQIKMVFLSGFFLNLTKNNGGAYNRFDGTSAVINKFSCIKTLEKYIYSITIEVYNPVTSMNQCTVCSEKMLAMMDPYSWGISCDLWKNIIIFLFERK